MLVEVTVCPDLQKSRASPVICKQVMLGLSPPVKVLFASLLECRYKAQLFTNFFPASVKLAKIASLQPQNIPLVVCLCDRNQTKTN